MTERVCASSVAPSLYVRAHMPRHCFYLPCPLWSRLTAPRWLRGCVHVHACVCVPVCTCVSSLFVLFPCVTFSHRHACHCRNSNAVTYARSLAPWLTGRLLRWNQKDVGTDHTSPSSFLGLTDGLSLSSSYAFSTHRDTFLRRISRTKSNEVWGKIATW